jgi:hypothetical protein
VPDEFFQQDDLALESNNLAVCNINATTLNALFPDFEIAQQLAQVCQRVCGTWLAHDLTPALVVSQPILGETEGPITLFMSALTTPARLRAEVDFQTVIRSFRALLLIGLWQNVLFAPAKVTICMTTLPTS